MRYLVAFIIGIGALFGVNAITGIFSMPRPWGSLLMGATVGITMVIVLLVWEAARPTRKDSAPAKPAMSDEDRARARAERRERLAAEAGVSLEGIDGSGAKPKASATDPYVPDIPGEDKPADASVGAKDDADGIESTKDQAAADHSADETGSDDSDEFDEDQLANDETSSATVEESAAAEPGIHEPEGEAPKSLRADEVDEEATGSSLENPPAGEPGFSVDALEDAESTSSDGTAHADAAEDSRDPEGSGDPDSADHDSAPIGENSDPKD